MELRNLYKDLKKYNLRIVLVSIVVAILAGYLAKINTPHYVAQTSLLIQKEKEAVAEEIYTYDGYYAQQVAEGYTDTVIGLLESPDLLQDALSLMDRESSSFPNLKKAITVEKTAPQVVSLQISLKDKKDAAGLNTAMVNAVKARVAQENTKQLTPIRLEVLSETPIVVYQQIPGYLAGIVGFFFSVTVGFGLVFLKAYLKEHE